MSKTQLKHLLLDVDFLQKPKIKALKYDFGVEGLLFYIDILCDMAKATDAEIYSSCIKANGEKYGFDSSRCEAFIAYLVLHGLINQSDKADYYFNTRVSEDQESLSKKQDKWRNQKRQQRDSSTCPHGQGVDKSKTDGSSVNIEVLNTEELNNKLEIALPEFQKPEIRQAINCWQVHRNLLDKEFDQGALDSMLLLYRGRALELADDIHHSILNGWKTLNQKPRNANYARGSPPKKSTKDVLNEMMAEELAKNGQNGNSEIDGFSDKRVRGSLPSNDREDRDLEGYLEKL